MVNKVNYVFFDIKGCIFLFMRVHSPTLTKCRLASGYEKKTSNCNCRRPHDSSRRIAGIAVAYTLVLLIVVRYCFVRTVDENVFRRRTLVYGAGRRAASISDLRRRADRRGFKIVGRLASPGDAIVGDHKMMTTNGKSVTDYALEMRADEIVVAMDNRRGNLPIRDLLDARVRGINVIDLVAQMVNAGCTVVGLRIGTSICNGFIQGNISFVSTDVHPP